MDLDFYQKLSISAASGKKQLCLLIDPDKYTAPMLEECLRIVNDTRAVDMLFIGGSLLTADRVSQTIHIIKENSHLPVILFPGSPAQVNESADGLLLLSLISGRNPDLLIGRHVEAAPFLKQSRLEIIPTGYMLVDGGAPTTVSYISNTFPIPADKGDIAACTAVAGELLGLRLIYMDGGSGALRPIPPAMIGEVKKNINIPLVVGGGIRSEQQLSAAWQAGADVVVIGNILEKDPELLYHFSSVSRVPAREMKSN
jgi:putative glycerol-1-phosphate prenyltransferase